MADGDDNPYVGPRPFERSDRPVFFGRDREIRELLSLVVAHRTVLLYATSGAGKTSLLNAGLLPLLEEEEGFEVFPSARVAGADVPPTVENPFVHNVIESWRTALGERPAETDGEAPSLAAFVAGHEHPLDADELPAPRLVVFDQFEELFTLHQQHWRAREPFFVQLAELLEHDPLLRVVVAIREDYLAQLDRYRALLPGGLRTRLRLERLRADAALRAVTGPVARARRNYAPGAAEQLVGDLLKMRVDIGGGEVVEVEGEYAEPVQLQVVCQSLWASLPPEVDEITSGDLERFGDVDDVLSRFYTTAVAAAAATARISEKDLRRSLERTFITPMGTRGTVYAGTTETGQIPNPAIEELERRHLLRGEHRAGTRWLELTHDRLIEPIRASNRARGVAAQARRVRRLTLAAIVLAVALAVAIAVAFWVLPSHTTVPQLRGMTPERAAVALEQAGLILDSAPPKEVRSRSPGRTVVAQLPAAGTDVKRGIVVTIVISLPTVPTLVGKTGDEARLLLQHAGLKIATQTKIDPNAPIGTVLAQTPGAGRRVPSGTTVGIVIAVTTGLATVPNVRGLTLAQADATLRAAGLTIQLPALGPSQDPSQVKVINQFPAPGTKLQSAQPVAVYTSARHR